jgi:cytochrome c oxidase subunit 3
MATVLTPPKAQPPAGGPPVPPEGGGFGGGGGGRPDDGAVGAQRYQTGMWLFLCAVTMVFAGFVSAYVVRRGMSADWRPLTKPPVLWFNTAVLLVSSVTIEQARRRAGAAGTWLGITSLLGAVFLVGQSIAWMQLRAAGVFLASNPSSSFFYLLTGAHGLHLLGGVVALFYVALRVTLQGGWASRTPAIEATTLYWHFMDGLWLLVFALVFVWR